MAKRRKSRRKSSGQASTSRGRPSLRSGSAASGPASQQEIAEIQESLTEEYRYVLTDLKNMGLLAAAMFALLIALALILT